MSLLDRLLRRLASRLASYQDPLARPLIYGDPARLRVHPTAIVNNALFNLSSGDVTVARYAFFGHNVAILTGTHDIATFGAERQVAVPRTGNDVVVGEGAWLSSFAIVVGPCTIGAHAWSALAPSSSTTSPPTRWSPGHRRRPAASSRIPATSPELPRPAHARPWRRGLLLASSPRMGSQ
jgi:hypothetical protein